MVMNPGRNYPEENRDRLANTNNMWTYPKYLDAHGPVKAHIPAPESGKEVDADAEDQGLESKAKKAEKAAKAATKEAAASFA